MGADAVRARLLAAVERAILLEKAMGGAEAEYAEAKRSGDPDRMELAWTKLQRILELQKVVFG